MLWVLDRIWWGDSNEHLNIAFYDEMTKIIFYLSSIIIKYAPDLFFLYKLSLSWAYDDFLL